MMSGFLREEKKRLGVPTSDFEDLFFASHDAWYGIPRIMVCLEKTFNQPRLVNIGGIRHEIAHTILHGSPEYYVFHIPEALRTIEKRKKIPRRTILDLLYLISIAVKDFEVTRLLYRKGYVEDQVAYNEYCLKPTKEDLQTWHIAQMNPATKLLAFTSLLKPVCSAMPLLEDGKYSGKITEAITQSLVYIPGNLSFKVKILLEKLTGFGANTHQNVEIFARELVNEFYDETGN